MSKKIIPALRINQWMENWNNIQMDLPDKFRSRPGKSFYIFSMSANELWRLSKVYRRDATRSGQVEEPYIQRALEQDRVEELKRYVKGGFPWSTLSTRQDLYPDLQMPGWLPTALIINIMQSGIKREKRELTGNFSIKIHDDDPQSPFVSLEIPDYPDDYPNDNQLPPFEIIDGQHRLYAFQSREIPDDYQLPVVAFYNLDLTWQAYLFYVINIKPKKINISHAYDLFPLLRTQEWLENQENGPKVYKEARAQEIVEELWKK